MNVVNYRVSVRALLALSCILSSQVKGASLTEAWVHRYSNVVSNGGGDSASKVLHDAAGDLIVSGTTDSGTGGSDILTIKYSGTDGSVLWLQRYNGPGNAQDTVTSLKIDESGNALVAGYSDGGASQFDFWTAKYAADNGALLWERRYNGPDDSLDVAIALAIDNDGNPAVTGYSYTASGVDCYTAKYAAADGELLWEHRYNSPDGFDDAGRAVATDASGNVLVSATTVSEIGGHDFYTAKYAAANGTLLWEHTYNGPANLVDEPTGIIVDGDGDVVVSGRSMNDDYLADIYTAKYAAEDGALLWEQRYNGTDNLEDGATAVALDDHGDVIITGSSQRFDPNTGYRSDILTAKYAADSGALLWDTIYDGPAHLDDGAYDVTVDDGGNVAVAGYSAGPDDDREYYTAKYAAEDGRLLWEQRYNGSAMFGDEATGVSMDQDGNVVVTGSAFGGDANPNEVNVDFYTAKYASADGVLIWEKRYDGPKTLGAVATGVAVDAEGNVVTTGASGGSDGILHFYTAKHAPDGALIWETPLQGPVATVNGSASAVAVDSSGNVIVTGYSPGGESGADYYTAKYAAADGALLWEKRYNGSANLDDLPTRIVVDADGNVVVTGSVVSSITGRDWYTAKYAAGDGALLWEAQYNGPADRLDLATSVAVDASGNVVVAGWMTGLGGISESYTVRYAAADAALLWDKRSNGPADNPGIARAAAVAVDDAGNVVVTGAAAEPADFLGRNIYTAKYSAQDGALLWERVYVGPNAGADEGRAVAIERNGNVVVTGFSENQLYTAKYAAADGSLLWEKRYDRGGSFDDNSPSLAVDQAGNVTVTTGAWATFGGSTQRVIYTSRYAAADGALLWEQQYSSLSEDSRPASSGSLALGLNGMIVVVGQAGSDLVTVVYRENLLSLTIEPDATGGYYIRGHGIAETVYELQHATSVTSSWESQDTITAPATGLIEFHVTNTASVQSFYRVVQP